MLGDGHAGFGGRAGETHREQSRQGAPVRPINLSDAIEKTCHQHRPCLKKHAERGGDRPIKMPLVDALPPTRIVQRVLHHHAEITRMVAAGHPLSDIARRLGLDRKTVRRYRDTNLDNLLNSARDRRPERAFMQVRPYMWLSYLPRSEGFHPVGGEWPSLERRIGRPSRSLPYPEVRLV